MPRATPTIMLRGIRRIGLSLALLSAGAAQAQSIVTVAGGGTDNGKLATQIGLYGISGLTIDRAGNIYVSEAGSNQVRRINVDGTVRTLAGAAVGAVLKGPFGLWLDGNNLYVSEAGYNGNRIRRIDLAAKTIVTVTGALDGTPGYSGDGGPALSALISSPVAVAVDG